MLKVCKVLKALKVLKVFKAVKVLRVNRARKEDKVFRVSQALQGQRQQGLNTDYIDIWGGHKFQPMSHRKRIANWP